MKTPSTDRAWPLLFESGWTVERIAQIWNQTPEHVAATLDRLTVEPLPPRIRQVPRLPATPTEAHERRKVIKRLYRAGWSIERLAQHFLYYTPDALKAIVAKRTPEPPPARKCACGCGQSLLGRQKFWSPRCQKRHKRQTVAPEK
jgi:hypothetical protein